MQAGRKHQLRKKRNSFKYLYVRQIQTGTPRGILQAGPVVFHCALGRGGLSAFKREGDGATPLGAMRIISGFHKPLARPLPQSAVLSRRLRSSDGWCDASGDANYNRPVRLPYRTSAETMLRADCLYDIGFVLDWNICPRRMNCGSAIFFHLAKTGFPPTEGCIALSRRNMERLMPHLTRRTKLIVIH